MASTSAGPVTALEQRVARSGAGPLITWYDLDAGSRIELSALSFANWVDKTVNLMASMGLDDADNGGLVVGLPLLVTNPAHWVGLVWVMAGWQIGARVEALPLSDLDIVDLAVIGPRDPHPVPGAETVACSLHPLGAGFSVPLVGVTDYVQVLAESDVHWTNGGLPSFVSLGHRLDARALASIAPASGRLLVQASNDPWTLVRDALVAPVLGGGSSVIVQGSADEGRLQRIRHTERVG